MKDLVETFEINNRINLYLLNEIDESWLNDTAATRGRNIGEQFAHIHNVRLMWFKAAAPELLAGSNKIEKENGINKKQLVKELTDSGNAMVKLLNKAFAENKVKGFKPHPAAFAGYIIAHESHHRGQIMLCLKENKHLTNKSLGFAIWEWGSR
ncbi:MAG: DinB family protein [Ferruginibacter sp.]